MCGDRKPEPGVHAARIPLHRCLDEIGELRERDDVVEARGNLPARHAHDAALEKDVLGAGQVLVESCGNLDERSDAAADAAAPLGRPQDAGEQLENRGLACPVRTDDPEGFAGPDRERDVLQGPELAFFERVPALTAEQLRRQLGNQVPQAVGKLAATEFFPDVLEFNQPFSHSTSHVLGKLGLGPVKQQEAGQERDERARRTVRQVPR